MHDIPLQLLSVKTLAGFMGKSTHWIYRHAKALGGIKIGGSWIFTAGNLQTAIEPVVAASPSFAAGHESSDSLARSKIATISPPSQKCQTSNRIDAELKHLAEKHGFDLDPKKGINNAVQSGKVIRWPNKD